MHSVLVKELQYYILTWVIVIPAEVEDTVQSNHEEVFNTYNEIPDIPPSLNPNMNVHNPDTFTTTYSMVEAESNEV